MPLSIVVQKLGLILLNAVPVFLMIILIPLIQNDYALAVADIIIIALALWVRYERKEGLVLVTGFFFMIISEYFFVSTGVETFVRHTLLGVMPLWLPILWAYGFVAIKRGVEILG
jgi:hypothetical protein